MATDPGLVGPRGTQRYLAAGRALALVLAILSLVSSSGCTGDILDPTGPVPDLSASTGPDGGAAPPLEASQCAAGQALCFDRCVDPSSDPGHCGQCGVVCPQGLFCNGGQCTRLCPAGELVCGAECVAGASDLANCGGCGVPCATGEYCSSGACSIGCAFSVCETAAGLECADTLNNARHCGACNAACPAGQSCVEGFCQTLCPEGRAPCDGA
jgi:hypothetical protein